MVRGSVIGRARTDNFDRGQIRVLLRNINLREGLMRKTIVFFLLFSGGWLVAYANQGKSQEPPKNQNGQVTVRGCVSRSSGHYILLQSDPSNSYVLEATGTTDIGHYLGQQVEVTGIESHTSPTTSHPIRETGGGPQVTIVVDSINTISKRCAH